MTSPTSPVRDRLRPTGPDGFTITEILVVIGIIVVIIGILLPIIGGASGKASRARTAADLQAIATGLEAYKLDFGDYPQIDRVSEPGVTGAIVLCRALIGPLPALDTTSGGVPFLRDGNDGPGFRAMGAAIVATGARRAANAANIASDQPQGKVYGPYISPEKFKLSTSPNAADLTSTILEREGQPILYFPARKSKPDITTTTGYVNDTGTANGPLYRSDDNPTTLFDATPAIARDKVRAMLGDYGINGRIDRQFPPPPGNPDTQESAVTQAPYLLWCSGPDGKFGPDSTNFRSTVGSPDDWLMNKKAVAGSDDVTNFTQ